LLDFGPVRFYIARHFGFCYGVENAIEISYKALEENPGKRVFLLSQMIHNQEVNNDLTSRGIEFILDTDGHQFIDWDEVKKDDVVIIPAFGTTLEIEQLLLDKGIEVQKYNTTCPFVEKVWNRSQKLGDENYTVIIHGKPGHEETRATFSHSARHAKAVVVRDMADARLLAGYVTRQKSSDQFFKEFAGNYSEGFDPDNDLLRVGVVNQTTMLATETQAIADYFKAVISDHYGRENVSSHFADTRDTLCYATNDNQEATYALLETNADLAIVVGGYNSSNTSHIVELCSRRFPTYFINAESEILSATEIQHYDVETKSKTISYNFLPETPVTRIVLTSGASCPDTLVDRVMMRIIEFYSGARPLENVLAELGDS
jgi:4-hydroxy-3-methylbut-2-enyl diphosphate reductase